MAKRRLRIGERGFSLIEVLAALLVFTLVTLGVIPLLASSIRGSNTSRSFTVGKNVAVEAMERARGLPYYIDYATQARAVDVLDLYFPDLAAYDPGTCTGYFSASATCATTGHTATGPGYLTTCPTAGPPECSATLPSGYTLTYQMSFAQEEVPPETTIDPESYDRVAPATTYDASPSTLGADVPTKLVAELIVTVRWRVGNRSRSYDLRTLLSDRQFGDLKVYATAASDYVVQLVAGFEEQSGGGKSEAQAIGGFSESKVESRRFSTADQTIRAAQLRVVDSTPDSATQGTDLVTPLDGATSALKAPPDTPGPSVTYNCSTSPCVLDHPTNSLGSVAGMDTTRIASGFHRTQVIGGVPVAEGNLDFTAGTDLDLWVSNGRADTAFDFDATDPLVAARTKGSETIEASTSATTNPLGDGVDSGVTAEFKDLRLFPVRFAANTPFGEALVVIDDFSAEVRCEANTDGTQQLPNAHWEATLWYWRDPSDDDIKNGSYVSVPLVGDETSTAVDPLQAIKTANPLVRDERDAGGNDLDMYLFDTATRNGYLTNWSSVTRTTAAVSEQGRVTSARFGPAINIETVDIQRAPRSGQLTDTNIGVGVGSFSCAAEDHR